MFVKSLTRGHIYSQKNTNDGLYITDVVYPDHYKLHVATTNPAYTANEKHNGGGYTEEHFQENINALKTVDIAIVSGGFSGNSIDWWANDNYFGGWRNYYSEAIVHPSVQLRLDSNVIEIGYEYSFENLWEKVIGNKVISTIDSAAQNARMFSGAVGNDGSVQSGVMISRYKNVPVLKDVSTLNLPSQLRFEFSFGSAGIFSAEEEVVKPILVLTRALSPTFTGKNLGFIEGNAPSTEYALSTVAKTIWNTINEEIKGKEALLKNDDAKDELAVAMGGNAASKPQATGKDGEKTQEETKRSFVEKVSDDVAQALSSIQNFIHEGFNSAAKNILDSGEYKGIKLRIGRFVLPPLIVKKVTFSFDFDKVDEYGFPYKGSLTLDGLETAAVASTGSIQFIS